MWRAGRAGRRRCGRRATASAAVTDCELQRRVLDRVLREHPAPLSYPDLADELLADPGDLSAAFALARAVRDLALAGLLRSNGLHVLPTPAALCFWRLEGDR